MRQSSSMTTHASQPAASDEELAAKRDLVGLHERYARRLLAFLAGQGVPQADLEDLHQDVWARIWVALNDRPFTGHFRGWLFQIARNLAIDLSRRRHAGALPPTPLAAGTGQDPAEE